MLAENAWYSRSRRQESRAWVCSDSSESLIAFNWSLIEGSAECHTTCIFHAIISSPRRLTARSPSIGFFPQGWLRWAGDGCFSYFVNNLRDRGILREKYDFRDLYESNKNFKNFKTKAFCWHNIRRLAENSANTFVIFLFAKCLWYAKNFFLRMVIYYGKSCLISWVSTQSTAPMHRWLLKVSADILSLVSVI